MSKLKGELVNKAYKWLRISGLTAKASPGEIADGLDMLESMMLEFRSRNICSSYVFEEEPDPSTDSRLESQYDNAAETCLAVRLAPFFGIEPSQTLMRQATQSLSNWSARSGKVNQVKPSNRQPRGSGNTFRFPNWIRYYRFEPDAPISCETISIKVNETNTFQIDFGANGLQYLNDLETIASYTTEVSNGINLISSSQNGSIINLEVVGVASGFNSILVTVTTSDSRVNPETVNFNVTSV